MKIANTPNVKTIFFSPTLWLIILLSQLILAIASPFQNNVYLNNDASLYHGIMSWHPEDATRLSFEKSFGIWVESKSLFVLGTWLPSATGLVLGIMAAIMTKPLIRKHRELIVEYMLSPVWGWPTLKESVLWLKPSAGYVASLLTALCLDIFLFPETIPSLSACFATALLIFPDMNSIRKEALARLETDDVEAV